MKSTQNITENRTISNPIVGLMSHWLAWSSFLTLSVCAIVHGSIVRAKEVDDTPRPQPESRRDIELQGWKLMVDERLFEPENELLRLRALSFLESKLLDIIEILPPNRLKDLQSVKIVLDLNCGDLHSMQYHPSKEWLIENGYPKVLAKCVHLPRATEIATRRNIVEQPWVILHELAHAYHDQFIGFDDQAIKDAYGSYVKSGHGNATLLFDGSRVKHYALTDEKEFFAEMTESFFGFNDFFPFNRAELAESEPEICALIGQVWGVKTR